MRTEKTNQTGSGGKGSEDKWEAERDESSEITNTSQAAWTPWTFWFFSNSTRQSQCLLFFSWDCSDVGGSPLCWSNQCSPSHRRSLIRVHCVYLWWVFSPALGGVIYFKRVRSKCNCSKNLGSCARKWQQIGSNVLEFWVFSHIVGLDLWKIVNEWDAFCRFLLSKV